MNTPFTPPGGPFAGGPQQGPQHPGFGFGFGHGGPRGHRGMRGELHDELREHRRNARREFRDAVREQRGGGFGPGFGRDFSGFGPGGPGGPGFGPGPRGRRGHGRGRSRGRRGDVRAAILKLLVDRPMHGYEMIQEIAERSQDLWKPSPGSVYPTLQLLEDEGLIVATETEGSKKLFELTDEGRAAAEAVETAPWDEITEGADPAQMNLRNAVGQLFGAVRQSAFAASTDQQQRIVDILNNARREIYQILGED